MGRRTPLVERGGRRTERGADRGGHRRSGDHRARQLAADGGGDHCLPGARRRRLGRDVPPLPLHHQGAGAQGHAAEVEPAHARERLGGLALEARARGSGALGGQRPRPAAEGHLGRHLGAVAGRRQRRGGVLPGVRHGGAPPARRADHPDLATRVHDPAKIFNLAGKGEIAIGADADFAIVETDGSKVVDAQELEYHDQEKWSPFDGVELKVFPVYTVLRGRADLRRGQGARRAGDGRSCRPWRRR